MFSNRKQSQGFTLIEILLVVAAIAILASIVIIAINPTKQLGDTRNATRRIDAKTILDATYQYSLDNNGALPGPGTIPTGNCTSTAGNEICRTGAACAGGIDLGALTTNEKYITAFPVDPSSNNATGTGYKISKTANNRVSVCAPLAEQGVSIYFTR